MPKIEKAFIQIYFCLIVVLFAWNSILTIRFPYGIDYGEAPLMDQVVRIERRETLYKANLAEPPYVIANYPPVYPTWVAVVNTIFRIPLFQSGRITSVMLAVLSSCIIGLFTYRLTESKWIGVLSATLFAGMPFIVFWSSLARVDSMALAFSLLGLYILFRKRDEPKWMVLAGVCFLLSIFTRQSYLLAGPLAGFVWLWNCNRKRAMIFIITLATTGLVAFGILNGLSHGGFYMNIVTANLNRNNPDNAVYMAKQLFSIWLVILLIGAAGLIWAIYTKFTAPTEIQTSTVSQASIVYGLAFFTLGAAISALTSIKVGSNVNYFFELIAAFAIWFGIGLQLFNKQKPVIKWPVLGLIFFQCVWILAYSYQAINQTNANFWQRLDLYQSLSSEVQSASRAGVVISDDYMDMIVLAGQRIYYQPFEYGELYYAGEWDPTAFAAQIEMREFPLIVIGGGTLNKSCCWPPSVIDAIDSNYQAEKIEDVLIYTPLK